MNYQLIHVLHSDELFTPLVLSQLFEQANEQVVQREINGPNHVEVWVTIPFRFLWDKQFLAYKGYLRNRFPLLPIKYLPGIDRLGNFPRGLLLKNYRFHLGNKPCIFHFRGDVLLQEFSFLKNNWPADKFVADIRGIWPAEKLLLQGVFFDQASELLENKEALSLINQMKLQLKYADAVTAVTSTLKDWVLSVMPSIKHHWVVPCSVKFEEVKSFSSSEDKLVEKGYTLGYLGGTASYQHLEDMVLPLFAELLTQSPDIRLLFITHQASAMQKLIQSAGISMDAIEIKSVPQESVQEELRAMDLGFLLRKGHLVNRCAQPVKLGEYLNAGVAVCIEQNAGGVEFESDAILKVSLEKEGLEITAKKIINYLDQTNKITRKIKSREAAKEHFSWTSNIFIHRKHYQQLLKD